ncbi:MAG TPA: spore germination protein [Firmicutes bacterium]|nr:spore germination protein [Bacillota bacterium]
MKKRRGLRQPIPVSRAREQGKTEKAGRVARACTGEKGAADARETTGACARGLSPELAKNVEYLKEKIGRSDDVVFRDYTLELPEQVPIVVVFVDGLASKEIINEYILEALTFKGELKSEWTRDKKNLVRHVKDKVLNINEVRLVNGLDELITPILSGEAAVLFDGYAEALICNTRGWPYRSIDEPETEAVIRGPRVGFTETLRFNTAQVRRWIRDPDLRVKVTKVGRRSQTDVALVYLESVANPQVVAEVERRLGKIDIDGVMESSTLQEMIEDRRLSLFPTIQSTERADRVVAAVLEGKVGIITDNTPFALIVPISFWEFYYAAEDYYHRWPMALLLRIVRFSSFFFSLYLPSLYVALSFYNPELIPFPLAVQLAGSREGVPFPLFLEVLLMELAIEIIREASARLPGPLGQTIGIVGGFILGDAAVRAGLISPLTTVVVALTAICSFTSPNFGVAISIRILRFPLVVVSLVGGLYGLALATFVLLVYTTRIRSFGVPFLTPFIPLQPDDLKDSLGRAPFWAMVNRPRSYKPLDTKRQKTKARNWWERLFSGK